MKTLVVRYKVKPGQGDENQRLIEEVFAQLERDKPSGVRYQVVRLPDGVSFMHMATVDAGPVHPLTSLDAFKHFFAGIKDRCEEPPVATEVQIVGAFDNLA